MGRKPTKFDVPFVVVVRFPSSTKEYSYLCNDETVKQGSIVVANGTRVQVVRTAAFDPQVPVATKYVFNDVQQQLRERRGAIVTRLRTIAEEEKQLDLWSKLKSPEAKKLVAELRRLRA